MNEMYVVVRQLPPHPPSITPEYSNYNRGQAYLAIVATLVSIALLVFLLRVWTRIKLLRFFGIDDWLMLVAVVCAIGTLIVFAALVNLGFGRHFWAISSKDVRRMGPWIWAFILLTVGGISFVKLSVAFFLLRIIHRRYFRRCIYGTIGILVPLTLVWLGTLLFQCIPISAAWDPVLRTRARCMTSSTYRSVGLFNSSINIVTDLTFVFLPLPIIWSLHVSLCTRLSLIAVLSLGFIACTAAIIRMPMIYRIQNEDDPFGHGAWLYILSVIEMTAGITAACLSSLKPILNSLRTILSNLSPSNITSTHRSSNSDSSKYSSRDRTPTRGPRNFLSLSTLNLSSLSRPKSTHLSNRFHDHTSDLDFDLETPRSRTTTHSRSPSNLTTFSTFTTFTTFVSPFNEVEIGQPISRPRTCSTGLSDLEDNVLGSRGGKEGEVRAGYAVSVTSGEMPFEEGEEGKSLGRMASNDESAMGQRYKSEEGGIVRTTEVTIT